MQSRSMCSNDKWNNGWLLYYPLKPYEETLYSHNIIHLVIEALIWLINVVEVFHGQFSRWHATTMQIYANYLMNFPVLWINIYSCIESRFVCVKGVDQSGKAYDMNFSFVQCNKFDMVHRDVH